MSLDEFRKASELYQRKSLLMCSVLLIPLVFFFAYAPFARRFESYAGQHFSTPMAESLPVMPIALVTVLAFTALIPLNRRLDRKYGLGCPHCRKPLAYPQLRDVIIASKHCPHCGECVIDETS